MNSFTIVFFGSTSDSVIALEQLTAHHTITCVVTQPPRPVGRNGIITSTPVQTWAQSHTIPFLSFTSHQEKSWEYENEQTVIDTLEPFTPELIVSASYGQKIPSKTIADAKLGGINIHPSILPRWRGADPVPWAMIAGDHQTGVTLVTLTEEFDKGKLVAQKKVPIRDSDYPDPLRSALFTMGAELLITTLKEIKGDSFENTVKNQEASSYARKFSRIDGYMPWGLLQSAMDKESHARVEQFAEVPLIRDYLKYTLAHEAEPFLGSILERFFRALSPWPGMWTQLPIISGDTVAEKRLKILSCTLSVKGELVLNTVQLEGKTAVPFAQFKAAYL